MSRMCFVAAVNRAYAEYIPWFIYYNSLAYPDSMTYIMLDHRLDKDILDICPKEGEWFIQDEAFGSEFVDVDALTIKYLRWLIAPQLFRNYDCISIGDVDMAYCPETPSYAEQHLAHCKLIGLPYSNFRRPGRDVLGGIHVIEPGEWYEEMQPIMDKYLNLLKGGRLYFEPPSQNEKLLFHMIAESKFGPPPIDLTETYHSCLASSNHHGVHIRNMELNSTKGLKGARKYENHKQNILKSVKTDRFQELAEASPRIGKIMRDIASFYEAI